MFRNIIKTVPQIKKSFASIMKTKIHSKNLVTLTQDSVNSYELKYNPVMKTVNPYLITKNLKTNIEDSPLFKKVKLLHKVENNDDSLSGDFYLEISNQ